MVQSIDDHKHKVLALRTMDECDFFNDVIRILMQKNRDCYMNTDCGNSLDEVMGAIHQVSKDFDAKQEAHHRAQADKLRIAAQKLRAAADQTSGQQRASARARAEREAHLAVAQENKAKEQATTRAEAVISAEAVARAEAQLAAELEERTKAEAQADAEAEQTAHHEEDSRSGTEAEVQEAKLEEQEAKLEEQAALAQKTVSLADQLNEGSGVMEELKLNVRDGVASEPGQPTRTGSVIDDGS